MAAIVSRGRRGAYIADAIILRKIIAPGDAYYNTFDERYEISTLHAAAQASLPAIRTTRLRMPLDKKSLREIDFGHVSGYIRRTFGVEWDVEIEAIGKEQHHALKRRFLQTGGGCLPTCFEPQEIAMRVDHSRLQARRRSYT